MERCLNGHQNTRNSGNLVNEPTHMAYAERNMLDLEAEMETRFFYERSDRLASEISLPRRS
jgi:hypothetical protein